MCIVKCVACIQTGNLAVGYSEILLMSLEQHMGEGPLVFLTCFCLDVSEAVGRIVPQQTHRLLAFIHPSYDS